MNATLTDLKDIEMVVPTIAPFNLLLGPLKIP